MTKDFPLDKKHDYPSGNLPAVDSLWRLGELNSGPGHTYAFTPLFLHVSCVCPDPVIKCVIEQQQKETACKVVVALC